MKRVLFITYYFPPSGKASIHWPLDMIKYLPDHNWEPIVVTVKDDTFTQKDPSLLDNLDPDLEVIRTKTYEPFNLYKKFIGKKSDEQLIESETISTENKSFTHRISVWLRMNLFIPDARIGWYFPAVKGIKKYLKNNKNFDAIISIGPPHSSHLLGKKISKDFNIPHFPVFIDPWVDIAYYKNFKRSNLTLKIDNKFEKSVAENAKELIFVTETMREDYVKKYPGIKNKSHVLYWGHNLPSNPLPKEGGEEEKVIVHAGNIFAYQNPFKLWELLKNKNEAGEKFRIRFIGTVAPEIKKSIERFGLQSFTEYSGFLPYKQMIEEIFKADILLVCATEPRHVPGKLFEYLTTGNPILAFGDDNNEVKSILNNANAGMIFNYDEDVTEFFSTYKKFQTDQNYVNSFDRKNIAAKLSGILYH